jgi:hypothetical protein
LNHNLPGAGFKNQIGASIGRDQYLRLPNEAPEFNQELPGAHLPLPTKEEWVRVSLVVQDASHVLTSDGEVGYLTGADPVFQDGDVSFKDEDVLWEAHGTSGGDASVNATGHQMAADIGTVTLAAGWTHAATGHEAAADVGTVVARGVAAYTATGHQADADIGAPVLSGAVNIGATGHGIAADVGTATLLGAAAYTATGHEMAADVGSPSVGIAASISAAGDQLDADAGAVGVSAGSNIVTTGHEIAADVGAAVLSGAASFAATGHELAADVGTPTIGGAGVAAPGGDVGAADVGTVGVSAGVNFAATGHELSADMGTAIASLQDFCAAQDSYHGNVADDLALVLTNGDAFPAGVDAESDVGAAVASGVDTTVVAPAAPRIHRRPVVWQYPKVEEVEQPEPSVSAEAFPRGVHARASVGAVVVKANARVIPLADFSRSRVGIVRAEVDYTFRDQQEEEFIQILLAA